MGERYIICVICNFCFATSPGSHFDSEHPGIAYTLENACSSMPKRAALRRNRRVVRGAIKAASL